MRAADAKIGKVRGAETLRLRKDLVRTEVDEEAVEILDPITARVWRFDEMQANVLSLFDGQHSAAQISAEVLGNDESAGIVEELANKLDELGLLVSEAPPHAEQLKIQQARAMRPRASKERSQKVAASVRWARDNLPFYRETLAGLADEVHTAADLVKLPMTNKADVRANFPERLIPESEDLQALVGSGQVMLATTSGSTGGRLQYVFDLERAFTRSMARHPIFSPPSAVGEESRSVTLTTPICNGQLCHRGGIPFEDRMLINGVLQLNSSERIMRLEKSHLEELVADMERHRPNRMAVDPVYMAAVTLALRKYGLKLPPFEFIATGWEYLTLRHREMLEQEFGVPVYASYGATDIGGGAAVTCANNRYHVLEDSFYFEFIRDGKPVGWGELGEIVITTLRHSFTRHIRYQVGDVGRPIDSCGCAFDDWMCFEIDGRVQDLLQATDGSIVSTRDVDDLFQGLHWLDFYQLIQREAKQFQLLGVLSEDGDKGLEEVFLTRLRGILGEDAEVRVQYVRELPIEQSLKYPPTKRKVADASPIW